MSETKPDQRSSSASACSHGGDKETAVRPRSHDLLPCPFCGNTRFLRVRPFGHENDVRYYWVYCLGCRSAGANAKSVAWAKRFWNRRAGQVADEPSAAGDGE